MPLKLLNGPVRGCALIARALGEYVQDVEVDPYLPGEDDPEVDCVINVRPLMGQRTGHGKRFASLYFVKGTLYDGDVQMPKEYLPGVEEMLKISAVSCVNEGIHKHDFPGEGFEPAAAYHLHLKGCNVGDLGRVLRAARY